MSDIDEKALKPKAEEEVSLPTTPVEETKATEEVIEPEVESAEETKEEVTETEKENTNKGYSNRVRELNTKANEAEEKAKSLEEKLTELTEQGSSRSQTSNRGIGDFTPSPQEPIFKPGEEIDPAEFERRMAVRDQRILQQATAGSELRSRQNEARSRIKTEAGEAIRRHPELNPDDDNYNQELSDTVTEAVWAMVKSNPYSASVNKMVDKLMKPYKGAVTKAVGKQTKEMAKQASQGAIKPTSVRKEDKSAEDKSLKELEKDLGILQA